jgi:hypothetical protein
VIVPLTIKTTTAVTMEEGIISKSLFIGKIDTEFVSINLYIKAIAGSGYNTAIGIPQMFDDI